MKAVFGILSLLIVLAVLAVVAKRQVQTVGTLPMTGTALPAPADPQASSVAGSAKAFEDQIRDQANRAVRQAADRAASADQ